MSDRRRAQRGAVAVITAVALTALLAIAGFSIDVGLTTLNRNRLQAFADASALACANANMRVAGSCTSSTNQASTLISALNVHNHAVAMQVPATCPATGQFKCVRASASTTWNTFFMGLVGSPSTGMSASAMAGSVDGGPCLIALDSAGIGLKGTGGSDAIAVNCRMASNAAVELTGGSTFTAPEIDYVTSDKCNGGCYPGVTKSPAVADPFADLVPPTASPTYTSATGSCVSGTCTFQPGKYTSGITISSVKAVFAPGAYEVVGKFSVSGGSSTVSSTGGVTFHLSGTSGQLSISGGGAINLSAPTAAEALTTGGITGMLFMQPASNKDAVISGGTTTVLAGDMYFPKAKLKLSGGTTADKPVGRIVVAEMELTGGDTLLYISSASYGSGPARLHPALLK